MVNQRLFFFLARHGTSRPNKRGGGAAESSIQGGVCSTETEQERTNRAAGEPKAYQVQRLAHKEQAVSWAKQRRRTTKVVGEAANQVYPTLWHINIPPCTLHADHSFEVTTAASSLEVTGSGAFRSAPSFLTNHLLVRQENASSRRAAARATSAQAARCNVC